MNEPWKHTDEELKEAKARAYFEGYSDAAYNYGIWRNGTQVIGCLDTPVKEAIKKRFSDPRWEKILAENLK